MLVNYLYIILDFFIKLLNKVPLLPELFLLSSILALLLYGIIKKHNKYNYLLVSQFTTISVIILSITVFLVSVGFGLKGRLLYENVLVLDFGSSFIKVFCLIVSIFCLIMTRSSLNNSRSACFEYFILYLFTILGLMFFISSVDLFVTFLALEVQSICLYSLVFLNKRLGSGVEAGIKFFILGATSSVILVFGISLLYGAVGSTNLFHLHNILYYTLSSFSWTWSSFNATMSCGLGIYQLKVILGVICIFTGLFFKITIVPFHMWAPDVYEGSPLPIVVFISTVPKIAVIFILCKISGYFFTSLYFFWKPLFVIAGLLSIITGTFMAFRQYKIKRFIAYSSIVHMGYMLICISAFTFVSLQFCLTYLIVYIFTILSLWSIILSIEQEYGQSLDSWKDLGGICQTNLVLRLNIIITFVSLGGLPPVAAFFAKFLLFKSLLFSSMFVVSLIVIILSLFSVYYYIRLIKILFFDSKYKFSTGNIKVDFSLCLLSNLYFIIIVFFFYFDIVWSLTEKLVWSIYIVI